LSRFIAPLVLVIALLGAAAPASAGLAPKLYGGQTKLGIATSARSSGGSCSSAPVLTDLILRCTGSAGNVWAKYQFTLPKKAGSVTAQVNFAGGHRGTSVSTKRTSDTKFRVTVTLNSRGQADIESVMIEYYYPG
jgi:hypothetical protein